MSLLRSPPEFGERRRTEDCSVVLKTSFEGLRMGTPRMGPRNSTEQDGSQPRSAGNRLDSWKQIAAYLKREVRTVQRWEKGEGLPVHRHLHDKHGTVYAYETEIDAWWASRRLQLEPEPE